MLGVIWAGTSGRIEVGYTVRAETTMRYLHVSAAAPADAIRDLDARVGVGGVEAVAGRAEETKENGKK